MKAKFAMLTLFAIAVFCCGCAKKTEDEQKTDRAAAATGLFGRGNEEPTGNRLGGGYQNIKWGMSKEEVEKGMQGHKKIEEKDSNIVYEGTNGLSIMCLFSQNKLYSVTLSFANSWERLLSDAVNEVMTKVQGIQVLGEKEKEVLKAENYLSEIESLQAALAAKFGAGKVIPNAFLRTPYGSLPMIKTVWEDGVTCITSQYAKPASPELQRMVSSLNPDRYATEVKRLGAEFPMALTLYLTTYTLEYQSKELSAENERLTKQKSDEAYRNGEKEKVSRNLDNI